MRKYFCVWKKLAVLAIGSYLSNRIDAVSFFIGKIIRFSFFLLLIITIFQLTPTLAGYTKYEVILFFMTYNLVDTLPQALFRGIYLFRDDIRKGNFDFILTKPINPLFYSFTRLTDILDIIFLIPIIAILIYTIFKLAVVITLTKILAYLGLIIVGQLIFFGMNIISMCITIRTLESENIILLYRYSFALGQYPPEVFSKAIQFFYTFLIPVMIIIAFPAKALLGRLSLAWGLFALVYALVFFMFSLVLWRFSLKRYQSASS